MDIGADTEVPHRMGVFRTQSSPKKQKVLKTEDNMRRSLDIAAFLRELIATNDVKVLCTESMSWPRNASAAAKVALCWGVMASICEQLDMPIVQSTPQQIKKVMCGKRTASKEEVIVALQTRYPGLEKVVEGVPSSQLEHPYDALAAIVSGLNDSTLKLLRKMS
jgi:Holliday junction resolvasome RuvABC endonuclease subunit